MTARTLRLELQLPPSVNNAYCQTAGGRRVLTPKARLWKKQAAANIRAQLLVHRCLPFSGTYSLTVRLADHGRDRDGDNALKLLIDAIVCSGAVVDDNRRCLRSLALEWSPDLPASTCEVYIEEISPAPIPKPAAPSVRTGPTCSKAAMVRASIMKALMAKGIRVPPEKIHIQ
jgi:hypothetical protein